MIKRLFLVGLLVNLLACTSQEEKAQKQAALLQQDLSLLNYIPGDTIQRLDGSAVSSAELDVEFQELIERARVAGLAVSIFNATEPVYVKTFGYANKEEGEPLQVNSILGAASLSKAVFAYLVSILVEEGTIDLDVPLQSYFDKPLYEYSFGKKWQNFQDLKGDERLGKITGRMCLTHTTGFQNWRWIPRPGDDNPEEKLKIIFEPGTQYYYSGEGIQLLQYTVEHITGKGLEELAQEKIFKPLHMENTSYVWQERFEDRLAFGHDSDENVLSRDEREQARSAGSMQTNLIDYSLFARHLLKEYAAGSPIVRRLFEPNFRIKTKRQFGPQSVEMTDENDDIALSYGLGWGNLQTPYGVAGFKEGHDEGFQHYTILFPEAGKGMLILTNSDNGESIYKELLESGIDDVYTPWEWEGYIPYNTQ